MKEKPIIKDKASIKKLKPSKKTSFLNQKELENKLNIAIENEDYELAAKIRDQIKKLNK